MYNPKSIEECQKEKKKHRRRVVDSLMTGVGIIASLSSVPQVIKIWETGTAEGLSLLSYLLALFAVFSWFLYGIYIKNKPLAITSGLTSLILGTVVIQIFIYA